ncbi:hypothetical protein ACH4S8_08450 [Streptomyces sp. NPDC021080]|uniref:hypothetical protein n=1 Tax=Streptomyces sp. NPDC021080 TaxID=3365110 RepID=UPI0037BD39FE
MPHTPPADILRRLADGARHVEQDLRLIPVHTGLTARPASPALPEPTRRAVWS